MDFKDIADLTLESATGVCVMVLAYKLYRLRCKTHSGCCGDKIEIDMENPGVNNNSII